MSLSLGVGSSSCGSPEMIFLFYMLTGFWNSSSIFVLLGQMIHDGKHNSVTVIKISEDLVNENAVTNRLGQFFSLLLRSRSVVRIHLKTF